MDDEEFKRSVLERLDAMDRRFDAMDRRMDAIVARLDQQDDAWDNLCNKVARLQKAVTSLTKSAEQSLGILTNLSRPA